MSPQTDVINSHMTTLSKDLLKVTCHYDKIILSVNKGIIELQIYRVSRQTKKKRYKTETLLTLGT